MNRPLSRCFRLAWAFLVLPAGAPAQEAAREIDPPALQDELPRLVRVQVEFIEMPHATLTRLLL